jgi:lipoprotein-releasing system permease protein
VPAPGFQWFVAWRYLLERPRKLSTPIWTAAGIFFAASVVCTLIATYVLEAPDPNALISGGSPYRQDVLLAAQSFGALAQLAAMLGVVRYFFTFFTTVSIAGVALGSMALVIVLSVMSGFETDLRDKILGSNAHILITKEEGDFTEYREVADEVRKVKNVVATTPYLTSEVVIAANNNYANVIIKGIDPHTVGQVTDLEDNLEQDRALESLWPLAPDGGILGPPADAGVLGPDPSTDPGDGEIPDPADLEVTDPMDYSGGALPDAGLEPPAPDELEFVDPLDYSGGSLPDAGPPEPDAGPARDAGPSEVRIQLGDREPPELWDEEIDRAPRIPPRVAILPGVLAGRELVKNIHLYVGQEVKIVSPLADERAPEPTPRVRFLRVAGTFYTGMYEYDLKFVYVDLEVLQRFLDLEGQVNGIEIRIDDPDETGPVVRALQRQLGEPYRVQDWQQINRNLFSALKLEKIAMFLVLAIIILVASFSIIGNLIMVVIEKAKEIALLKTLGAANGGVMRIFITQGFFIGLVGTAIGVIHGLIACVLAARFGLPLDPDVYYIDKLPIHIESSSVVAVSAAGLLISVLATVYPAWVAARLRPVEGLRYE